MQRLVRRSALFAVVAIGLLAFCGSAGAARFYLPLCCSEQRIGGFQANADGSFSPLAGSPFTIASGSSPSGIAGFAFAPDGARAVASFATAGGVLGLKVSAAGAVAPAQEPLTGSSRFGLAVTPDGHFAYTSESSGGISAYSLAPDGTLAPLPGSPFDSGVLLFDLAVSPDGRHLFAIDSNGVSRYAINPDGTLTRLGTTPVAGAASLQTAPSSPRLFVGFGYQPSGAGVAFFDIGSDGGLAQDGPPALTGDESINRFTVSSDGTHLYMADGKGDQIVTAAIGAEGTLSVVNHMRASNPKALATSPDGHFLYWFQSEEEPEGGFEGIEVAAIGNDGVPQPVGFAAPWQTLAEERLAFQPQPPPVASFSARPAKPGEVTEFDARGSSGAARYDWDFGDGSVLPNGGPVPSHVYAKPGSYQVTLTVSDSQGCSRQQVYTGQSTVCPGGTTPVTTATVETLPVLGRVRAVPKAFVPKPWGRRVKGKFGTTFRYRVNEPATVRFKIERRLQRKCGRHSVLQVPGERLCVRYQRLGSRAKESKAGPNALRFTGDLHGKALPPGGYRATVVATDKSGERSEPKTVGFRVLATP